MRFSSFPSDDLQDFRNGLAECQSLQSSCEGEVKKREALEFALQNAQSENGRLMQLYTDSLRKLADKVELHAQCQSLKEELDSVMKESMQKEIEVKNAMEFLKQEHATRLEELESQIRFYQIQKVEDEAKRNQLSEELAMQGIQLMYATRRFEEVGQEIESKYHYEIQGLKDCLLVQQEENNELCIKLQALEKELLISRTKLAEHQRDLIPNLQMEKLKQKIMNLRKENEVLRRERLALDEG